MVSCPYDHDPPSDASIVHSHCPVPPQGSIMSCHLDRGPPPPLCLLTRRQSTSGWLAEIWLVPEVPVLSFVLINLSFTNNSNNKYDNNQEFLLTQTIFWLYWTMCSFAQSYRAETKQGMIEMCTFLLWGAYLETVSQTSVYSTMGPLYMCHKKYVQIKRN